MLERMMIEFGYTKEQYNFIINAHNIKNFRNETLIKKFKSITEFLLINGYSKNDIIKMTSSYPTIFSLSVDFMNNKINDFLNFGYTKEEIIKMTKLLPSLYSLSMQNIKEKFDAIMALGYKSDELFKLTKSFPYVYAYSIINMKQKIDNFISLGYTKEDIVNMSKYIPALYSFSVENIKKKLHYIESLGYTKEEVIYMTKLLPPLFSFSIENIKGKIEFYDSIGMHDLAIVSPKNLMQSITLSYARYKFLSDRNICVDMQNYNRLFVNAKKFEKMYGVSKEWLLDNYNYDKYLEEINIKRVF